MTIIDTARIPAQREGRLITPTGVLISAAAPDTDEWFAVRKDGITATDIPKILDLSKYGNALSVWMDKRGESVDLGAGEAAYWGNVLEPDVANHWARANGSTVETVGVIAHRDNRWKRVSLDRIVGRCPDGDGPCPLEVKTRSAFVAGLWQEGVPDDVLAQCMWQLHVTGYQHTHVALLLGGQRYKQFRIDREPQIENLIVGAAERVWADVLGGFEPEVDPSEVLLKILNVLHPDRTGELELNESVVRPLLAAHKTATVAKKAAKAMETAAKAALVQAMGGADVITVDGRPIVSYPLIQRKGFVVAPTSFRKIKVIEELGEDDD